MFNLFKKSKADIHTKSTDNFNISMEDNTILFCVDDSDELTIKISAQNLKKKDAKKFAEVLCFIENGLYRSMILKMLQDMAAEDPDRQEFISELILFWSEYIDTYKDLSYNKEGPVVPPTKFSMLVHHSESK